LDEAAGVSLEGFSGLGQVEPFPEDRVLLQRGAFREEARLVFVKGAYQHALSGLALRPREELMLAPQRD